MLQLVAPISLDFGPSLSGASDSVQQVCDMPPAYFRAGLARFRGNADLH